MNILTRYVMRQILVALIFVTLGLVGVIWLTQSLRFVDLIVNRGLSLAVFVELTVVLLPNFLELVLPVALFTVLLFTYNKLIQDRELVAMRAAGLSQFALARPAIVLGLVVTAFGYLNTLHLLPGGYERFRDLQTAMRSADWAPMLLREGTFNTQLPGLTIYIREVTNDGELLGVLAHDIRDRARPVTFTARHGRVVRTADGPQALLRDGTQQISRGDGRTITVKFERYSLALGDPAHRDGARFRKPREHRLNDLFTLQPPDIPPKDLSKFRVEGHGRLTTPLLNLGFALMAVAALVAGGFSRRGQTPRILIAIGLMVGMQIAFQGTVQLAIRDMTLIPLIYVCTIAPILGGGAVLWFGQMRRMSRSRAHPGAVPA